MTRYLLIFPCLLLGCTALVAAQARKCSLRINPYENVSSSYSSQGITDSPVGEASAVLVNSSSKIKRTSELVERTPFFRGVREGRYIVLVSKKGFKVTSSRQFEINCDHVNNEEIFCLDVSLVRGDSSETEMDLNRFTVRGGTPETGTAYYDCMLPLPPPFPPVRKFLLKMISGGVLNGKAISLPKPAYPPAAKAVRASGTLLVEVLIDERGNVVWAKAVGGSYVDMTTKERKSGVHPLLISASESAARQAKFSPTLVDGKPVNVTGMITYTFVP